MNNEKHLDPAISKLYQATPKAQPSAKIDESILAQAREMAHSKASKRQKMHYQRWWLPLSTAALLVMGISVTIKIMHQPESMTQISVPLMAPMATPIAEQELKMDAEGPQALRQERAEDRPSAATSAPTLAPAAAMMFEDEMDEISLDAKALYKKEKKGLAAKARARLSESREERAKVENRALLKRMQPNRFPAVSGTIAIQSDSVNESITAPLSVAPIEAIGSKLQWSSPEEWLMKIGELLASGKKSEALTELKIFSSNHPDYPLSDALQRLLRAQ